MEIKSLTLENYRNFNNFDSLFPVEGAVITGNNGIGKTNILEAIAFCAFGKSIQNKTDMELINFEKDFFRIDANFLFKNKHLNIKCAVSKNQKKIFVDDIKQEKISELYRYIKVVYFSPSDINIVSNSPSYRRLFLDQAISQSNYYYLDELKEFNRILKQRNMLLKMNYDKNEKQSWDIEYCKAADNVVNRRIEFINRIRERVQLVNLEISGSKDDIDLCYNYSLQISESKQYHDSLFEFIKKNEFRECEAQRSLAGPHLEDMEISVNGISSRRFASQGQKRSIAIALRLVQAEMIAQTNDEFPILMFDDVLAELDAARANNIFHLLKSRHQIFIATPHLTENYKRFNLEEIRLENNHET